MIDLILGIVFFNIILILFKLFARYNVDNFQAIVVNYAVAGIIGVFMYEQPITVKEILSFDWLYYAVLIGLIFVTVFKFLADGTQKIGIAIATVANKMSVVLPVIASFILYGDSVTSLKIIGLVLALVGVVLTSSEKGKLNFDRKYIWLVIIIFLGQGISDILFNYAQMTLVLPIEAPLYISFIFLSAFAFGVVIIGIQIIQKTTVLKFKNLIWGIALGIPNYLTVLYFFRALEHGLLESSEVYPILNMGVIVLASLSGYLIFKERLAWANWIGIVICLVAICFISLERILLVML